MIEIVTEVTELLLELALGTFAWEATVGQLVKELEK